MTDNWEVIKKIPQLEEKINNQGKQIIDLYDNKTADLQEILNNIVYNNNGKYILTPGQITMEKNQITFSGIGGAVNNAYMNTALQFAGGSE